MYWMFVDCIVVMLPVVKLPCHNTTLNAVPVEDIIDSAVWIQNCPLFGGSVSACSAVSEEDVS